MLLNLTHKKDEGEFDSDKFHGKAIVYFQNNDKFEGELQYGRLHGNGKLTTANGTIIEGKWAYGRKIDNFVYKNIVGVNVFGAIKNDNTLKQAATNTYVYYVAPEMPNVNLHYN